MKITVVMVATYMLDCVLIGTKPCKYFQLNSPYFNSERGIFSKIDLDKLIPDKWRLAQRYDDGEFVPASFPVFVKPEWGENAQGIYRADNESSLKIIRERISSARVPYIIQESAQEDREFEIFSLRHHKNKSDFAVLTITEAINNSESNPINSIHNPKTLYQDISDTFSETQKQTLWEMVGQIGEFGISRLSVRSDSTDQLLNGNFHVIELNLFTPMPIHLLDPKYGLWELWKKITSYMLALARLTKFRDKTREEKPVYTGIRLYNRKSWLANFIREKA